MILKVIGIILLVILALLLTAVLLILFVPVRYRADVSFEGKPDGEAAVSWLLHLVRIRVSYHEHADVSGRVLWFKLFDVRLWPPEDEEEQIRETIMNVIRDILSDGDVMYNMMDLKNYDDYTYFHSVNVATLAAVLGVRYGLSEYELKVLTTGALLHDIGKKFVKADVLNARRPLTEEEKRMVLQHPKLGYEFLKRNYDFDPDVCEGVLGHHEWYNGEGYPLRRSGENISIYARIIKVADVYDAMTSKRPYHDALSPSDAVEYIMAMNESEFDPAIVDIFLKWVAVYPVGCEVELSDGRHAVVVKNYHDFLLRPKIRVMESGEEIDLLSDIDARHITILRLAV